MGAPVSPQLCTSILVVSASTYLYNLHPPPRPVAAGKASEPLPTAEERAGASRQGSLSCASATHESHACGDDTSSVDDVEMTGVRRPGQLA